MSSRFCFPLLLIAVPSLVVSQAAENQPADLHAVAAHLAVNSREAGRREPPQRDMLREPSSDASDAQRQLRAILAQAQESLRFCRSEIRDYTCTLVAQERINGKLIGPKACYAKVRHCDDSENADGSFPSIYLNFQAPSSMKGREVLLVTGQNDGKMLVRKGGKFLASLTTWIEPTSDLAMQQSRYSIHEFGIQRLVERMIDYGQQELTRGSCQVAVEEELEMDGRLCRCFEIVHPERQDGLPYHVARIYIDRQLQLPIRFEAFDWPSEGSDRPVLLERYIYRDLKLNVGLTDADFDRNNSEYQFQ